MKKTFAIILAIVLALGVLAGCGKTESTAGAGTDGKLTVIKVGASVTPHAQILNAAKELLKAEGYDLQVTEFTDYVLPNTALNDGTLDANYFQHKPYLDDFNANNDTDLASAASIHYEPFGIYAGKCKSLDELSDGAKIAVPNDGSNEARALKLLESLGYIKLNADAGYSATKLDIAENTKNLDIVEMDAAQLVNALQDVDFAVINGNYALQGGLNAGSDALATEDANSDSAQTYANIIAVKAGHENDPGIQALIKALKSDTIRDFINNTYSGAVVPLF